MVSDRKSLSVLEPVIPFTSFASLGCQNYTKNILGAWTFTDSDMKLDTGQEIQSLACLAVIRIGEDRSVGVVSF